MRKKIFFYYLFRGALRCTFDSWCRVKIIAPFWIVSIFTCCLEQCLHVFYTSFFQELKKSLMQDKDNMSEWFTAVCPKCQCVNIWQIHKVAIHCKKWLRMIYIFSLDLRNWPFAKTPPPLADQWTELGSAVSLYLIWRWQSGYDLLIPTHCAQLYSVS